MELFCLVHDTKWRGRFQFVLNELRSDVLNKSCVQQFQKRVCACRHAEPTEDNGFYISDEFDFASVNLPKPVTSLLEDLSIKNLWDSACNHSNIECVCPTSVKLLVYLTTLVLNNDFTFVTTKTTERKVYKFTSSFPIMSFDPEHLGLMIGAKGRNIKRFEREFACSVKLVEKDGEGVWARVESTCNMKDTLPDLMAKLSLAGQDIAKKRAEHDIRVKEYYKRKSSQRNSGQRYQTGLKAYQISVKKLNRITYERKAEAQIKHRQNQLLIPPKLEGSRCLNCLEKYSQESFREATCRYHPGFLVLKAVDGSDETSAGKSDVTYEWTCCETGSDGVRPDHSQHHESGCAVGIHNWRCESRKKKHSGSGHSLDIHIGSDFVVN